MKKLTLMRHAKSDWANPALDDAERPLNTRGRNAAAKMGSFIAENDLTPDLVLCSAATRTRQTLELMAPHLTPTPKVTFRTSLYLASPSEMLKQINATEDKYHHLLVLGHNPGLETLAMTLANPEKSNRNALIRSSEKFPTCAHAYFELKISAWTEIAPGQCLLLTFTTPRML